MTKNEYSHACFLAELQNTTIEHQINLWNNPQTPTYEVKEIPENETNQEWFERERWEYWGRNSHAHETIPGEPYSKITDIQTLEQLVALLKDE